MNEKRIEALLRRADQAAGEPLVGDIRATHIRRRLQRRRLFRTAVPLAAAAAIVLSVTISGLHRRPEEPPSQPQRIASLEEQVEQLQAQTDATLKLIQEVLEKDRRQRRLAALEAELASIPDPVRQIEQQVDKTAFLLIYQADRLYQELNETESAVAAYKQVIHLFPDNRWAQVARERLSQIEQRQINKSEDKGEAKCEPRNA